MMNKRGVMDQLYPVLIMGVVLLGLILVIFLLAIGLPMLTKGLNIFNTAFQGAIENAPDKNITVAGKVSVGNANTGVQVLEWISYALIIMFILAFFIMCFYVRTYPFLSFIWIGIVIVLVVASLIMTVAYQNIMNSGGWISDAVGGWKNTNYILAYLPHIVAGIGIIGGIIMFILASREPEAEVMGL